MTAGSTEPDIYFYFDPICPFAWITSRWVERVVAIKRYEVEWRFISLRMLNRHIDYDAHFPPEYEHGHTAGLRLLRVAAGVRAELGTRAVGPFYTAAGSSVFDRPPSEDRQFLGTVEHAAEILRSADLPVRLAVAADDASFDVVIESETDEALAYTGRDVGTPIIAFRPPDGPAFFGPVISRVPSDDDAVALWDSVVHLATFPGFAELKRSLRERPQLRSFGVEPGGPVIEDDWHGGSRRQKN